MKFKVGDRVLVVAYKATGTIIKIEDEDMIVVDPDDKRGLGEFLEPIEKHKYEKSDIGKVKIMCGEDDLELLGQTKTGSDWKDIWDSN